MKRRDRAFTLIEVLLGLLIFSVVIVCVYSSFHAGILLSRRAEVNNSFYREIRWTLNLLADELSNMVPYDFSNSYPNQTAFLGSDHKITFILPTKKGLKFVSYYLQEPEQIKILKTLIGQKTTKNVSIVTSSGGSARIQCLVREEQNFIDFVSDRGDTEAEIEVIATNVKQDGLRFYYGYFDSDKSYVPTWKTAWVLKDIPSNVRVEIDFVSAEKGPAPLTISKDILIPPGYHGPG